MFSSGEKDDHNARPKKMNTSAFLSDPTRQVKWEKEKKKHNQGQCTGANVQLTERIICDLIKFGMRVNPGPLPMRRNSESS
jgi:hypothetical protein